MRQYIPEHSPQRQSQTSPDPHHPKRPGRSRRGAKTKTTRRPRYCFARPSGVSDGAPQTLATEDLRLSERPSRSRSLTQGEAVARQRALETAVRRPLQERERRLPLRSHSPRSGSDDYPLITSRRQRGGRVDR